MPIYVRWMPDGPSQTAIDESTAREIIKDKYPQASFGSWQQTLHDAPDIPGDECLPAWFDERSCLRKEEPVALILACQRGG